MLNLDGRIQFHNNDNDVLTVGELLVDMISEDYDDSFECDTYHKHFGGSPSNIAMNARKLGIRSIVASAVGRDPLGRFLIKRLQEAGLRTDYVQQKDESTSMVLVSKSKASPIPVFYRGADYLLDYTPELEAALLGSGIIHFSCWPLSMSPARQTIERLVDVARDNGILIGFDPNYHPMIWPKGEDGVGYVKSILARVDIVKPSEDDAQRLFGDDAPERQIDKFLELGAKLVILTLGKDGAIVSDGGDYVRFDTKAVEVVDTTGAGDAFWSGFYAAIVQGLTIREALEAGLAVSAYKLKFTGAVTDLPKLETVRAMYRV